MTFDEQFPTLKDKRASCYVQFEKGGWEEDPLGEWVQIRDIEERCLDKQRVREAFDTWFPNHDSLSNRARAAIEKELGL